MWLLRLVTSATAARALSVGIDLGTSTSCCAYVSGDGAPALIPRRLDGGKLTQSVAIVDASGAARLRAPDEAPAPQEATVTSWKRAIGLDRATAAWRVEEATKIALRLDDGASDPDGYVGAVATTDDGGSLRVRPTACAAAVVRDLLDDCEAFLGERPTNAVVGVSTPASEAHL